MMKKTNWTQIPKLSLPDMQRRIFTGQNVMLVRNVIRPHAILEAHSHPHEQMIYVLGGRCAVTAGTQRMEMAAGDMALIPGGETHQVTALGEEELDIIDIFSPVREDFLAE
jgi:quercetin dioxygenase-like cupin family protein